MINTDRSTEYLLYYKFVKLRHFVHWSITLLYLLSLSMILNFFDPQEEHIGQIVFLTIHDHHFCGFESVLDITLILLTPSILSITSITCFGTKCCHFFPDIMRFRIFSPLYISFLLKTGFLTSKFNSLVFLYPILSDVKVDTNSLPE